MEVIFVFLPLRDVLPKHSEIVRYFCFSLFRISNFEDTHMKAKIFGRESFTLITMVILIFVLIEFC